MLKIAISKGRVENEFCKILEKAGFNIDPILNKKRKLLVKLSNNIELIFVKAEDIGTYLKYDSVDIGILGKDILIEKEFSNYSELLDLNVGKCKFCLASNSNYSPEATNKRIATKYPKITEQYFRKKNEEIEIIS